MSANAERSIADQGFREAAEQLVRAGTFLFSRGWVPATSGNFSVRLPDGEIAITVSGRHKGHLSPTDIMRVDGEGHSLTVGKRPSAETLLHTQLYARFPQTGAVLHTHSRNATVLSRQAMGDVVLEGYELLKAFRGIDTHATSVVVPVFPNDQDIPRLATRVAAWLDAHPHTWGYLIAGHGLYTWGVDVQETLRHLEAFEFLFDCELTTRG
ncbi:MAG: methylthioribulose 1-phosphate dehydratase [Thiohalomonadaceae bacterium]